MKRLIDDAYRLVHFNELNEVVRYSEFKSSEYLTNDRNNILELKALVE